MYISTTTVQTSVEYFQVREGFQLDKYERSLGWKGSDKAKKKVIEKLYIPSLALP